VGRARLEGFEPPLTQIRSLRLYPLSYRRAFLPESRYADSLPPVYSYRCRRATTGLVAQLVTPRALSSMAQPGLGTTLQPERSPARHREAPSTG
jgi:hypothetical protein